MNYVYILRCNDGTLYTGWTNDLINRVNIHNKGKGAKYTKARLPAKLVYYETYNSKSDALKREYEIKQYSKKDKENMISIALLLAVISEMTIFMK